MHLKWHVCCAIAHCLSLRRALESPREHIVSFWLSRCLSLAVCDAQSSLHPAPCLTSLPQRARQIRWALGNSGLRRELLPPSTQRKRQRSASSVLGNKAGKIFDHSADKTVLFQPHQTIRDNITIHPQWWPGEGIFFSLSLCLFFSNFISMATGNGCESPFKW